MKKLFLLFTSLFLLQYTIVFGEYKSNSVLSTDNWIKVATTSEGIYKITYEQLENWGINNPSNVAIYSNGGYLLPMNNSESYPDDLTQLPILHSKDASNNEAIFFFSTGNIEWTYNSTSGFFTHEINLYTDNTYFYITDNLTKSDEPENISIISDTPEITINNTYAFQLYENENINLIESGRRWYCDKISYNSSKSISFESPDVVNTNIANLTIAAASGGTSSSSFILTTNNNTVATLSYSGTSQKATYKTNNVSITSSAELNIELTYTTTASNAESWLDYIEYNYMRQSKLYDSEAGIKITNPNSLDYTTVQYQLSNANSATIIWNITNPLEPKNIKYNLSSSTASFISQNSNLQTYWAFTPSNENIPEPTYIEEIDNQNIHGSLMYDYIIVTHPDFLTPSETLAEYHRENDNLSVLVVTTDEVFNEFSSGSPDPSAIRNMARMFYNRKTSTDSLRYLLLMGDGSYDNHENSEENNFIPTYQILESETEGSSYTSDDYFGLLDDNEGDSQGRLLRSYDLDIGIGRITCESEDDANNIVDKIMNYNNSESNELWKTNITFVADDVDESNEYSFMDNCEETISQINSDYNGFHETKIYSDAYTQINGTSGESYPEVTTAISQQVEEGSLIVTYFGHANERGWASEEILLSSDISAWGNSDKLPLFVTGTCDFAKFDAATKSAGEYILSNSAGGGIALFTTTRQVSDSNNKRLILNFYNYLFQQDSDGKNYRLGDVNRFAKNETSDSNMRSFILLGDPALQLSFPKYNVKTTTINGQDISDTVSIGALEKVTINASITDNQGNTLSNYNGTAITVVYDKAIDVETMDNENYGAYTYADQSNVIYKGESTVTNGEFSVSFIVPKDISYSTGTGKIVYYAYNDSTDANGSFDTFLIGGSSESPNEEDEGPEVNIYINDEKFEEGDKVASSSILLVKLFDESGINTVGTGIGHDLIAVLDEDYNNPTVLNDYYSSELDSYQEGTITFPLSDLDIGEHTISVKAWDIQNNSTTEEISFFVDEGFEVTAVYNAPNPVNTETTFHITHNLPGDVFDVQIEIYNLKGIKIEEISKSVSSYDTLEIEVDWNLSDTDYPVFRENILVYRIQLSNTEGYSATGIGKLLILNN